MSFSGKIHLLDTHGMDDPKIGRVLSGVFDCFIMGSAPWQATLSSFIALLKTHSVLDRIMELKEERNNGYFWLARYAPLETLEAILKETNPGIIIGKPLESLSAGLLASKDPDKERYQTTLSTQANAHLTAMKAEEAAIRARQEATAKATAAMIEAEGRKRNAAQQKAREDAKRKQAEAERAIEMERLAVATQAARDRETAAQREKEFLITTCAGAEKHHELLESGHSDEAIELLKRASDREKAAIAGVFLAQEQEMTPEYLEVALRILKKEHPILLLNNAFENEAFKNQVESIFSGFLALNFGRLELQAKIRKLVHTFSPPGNALSGEVHGGGSAGGRGRAGDPAP